MNSQEKLSASICIRSMRCFAAGVISGCGSVVLFLFMLQATREAAKVELTWVHLLVIAIPCVMIPLGGLVQIFLGGDGKVFGDRVDGSS